MTVGDDLELVTRIKRGDHDAFRALADRHGKYLFGVARALTGNDADAEDIVQEALMALARGSFRGESAVRTWLVRVLVNQSAMLRRTRGRRGGVHAEFQESLASPSGPADAGSAVDAKLDLNNMLAALSPEHRQVIVLRELQGLSYEEMAHSLGIPRGTVESRLHRAREELRKKFKGYLGG